MFDSKNLEDLGGGENVRHGHLGAPLKPSEMFRRAYQAWLSYFDQKESFDQKICRLRDAGGIAIPQTLDEMRQSNQKARLLRQELIEPLRALKIPTETENAARSLALREHERKWKKR